MVKPVKNKKAVITSPFGKRTRPDGVVEDHGGIDIAVPGVDDVPVYATCSGRIGAITDASLSCGNAFFIKAKDGDYYCLYMHLKCVNPDLAVNDEVLTGDYLGIMGNTGNSRGVHLHYGHRKGMASGTECFNPIEVSSLYK